MSPMLYRLSYGVVKNWRLQGGSHLEGDGRGERTRTSGLAVPNRALYQAELRPAGHRRHAVGRSERNRTSDLPDPNRARYQAALRSEDLHGAAGPGQMVPFHAGGAGEGYWSGRRGSNPRHPDWKSGALPTELHPQETGGRDSRAHGSEAIGNTIRCAGADPLREGQGLRVGPRTTVLVPLCRACDPVSAFSARCQRSRAAATVNGAICRAPGSGAVAMVYSSCASSSDLIRPVHPR